MDPFKVFSGADKEAIEADRERRAYESLAIMGGRATRTHYLNGGSDTRRAAIEYYKELAAALGVGISVQGNCIVTIGGPPPRTD